jgi:hypothetical protein
MRFVFLVILVLMMPMAAGCAVFNPNSRWNVNRGEYHDDADLVGREGRGDQAVEKAPDGMGSWLYSPKARAINRNLGVED